VSLCVQVLLDKPVYIGQAVLDLSKLVMYRVQYEKLAAYAQKFGGEIQIAGGDTDSLFLVVLGISLSQQLLPAMLEDGLLDSSNYPATHPLYSTTYKARLGCVKDESGGRLFQEWVLLKPKCYSMLTVDEKEHKRAKGVQRSVVSKEIRHQDYVSIFEGGEDAYREVRGFRSQMHAITTIRQEKKALCLWEDKRAWTSLNENVAFGHYSLSSPPTKRARIE
jgi:hypothetical protein